MLRHGRLRQQQRLAVLVRLKLVAVALDEVERLALVLDVIRACLPDAG
ncbi:hypothetical protein PKCBPO_03906 [Methylorubrum thiocyanatum]